MQTNKALPKEAVEEFRRLYKARFNKDLSDEEALAKANNLFGLYQAVYGFSGNKQKPR